MLSYFVFFLSPGFQVSEAEMLGERCGLQGEEGGPKGVGSGCEL